MLVGGTQMHIITFLFVCIEVAILFYLFIYKLSRPNDRTAILNIYLIALLIIYNITCGLLPDPNLPGSYFLQTSLAYATGFITPCYFPYYVYKAFGLEKMKFHAFRGVFLCLISPFLLFVLVFAISGKLDTAKNILVIPLAYALWVIYTLNKAVSSKYNNDFKSYKARQERIVLLLSLTPWAGLPIIDWLNLGQALDATVTNLGFLTMFTYQVNQNIKDLRLEHQRLVESEQRLKTWNTTLQLEVEKRTSELARINEQQMNTFINLAHETKTPLTLVNNYMDEYMAKHETSDELEVVKTNLDKLSADILNLFDLEKFKKGFTVYNHDQVCNFSKQLEEAIPLFRNYANKRGIKVTANIETGLLVKADPLAINRITNNLIENAIKYSNVNGHVHIFLKMRDDAILFSVKDTGPGINKNMQSKIFEPYFQIATKKMNSQGMGLGLPIVKKVVDDLHGSILVNSDPTLQPGTEMIVRLSPYLHPTEKPAVTTINIDSTPDDNLESLEEEFAPTDKRKIILVVEDNASMLQYMTKKLREIYNVYQAKNGNEAIKKLNSLKALPDLIISDVMMDKLDGFSFANILSKDERYNHIPLIFLTAKSSAVDKMEGLKLGAVDYLQKPFLIKELIHKVQSIITISERQRKSLLSGFYINPPFSIKEQASTHVDQFATSCKKYGLTTREKDIAQLVCLGSKYKTIAEQLFISEKTVAKHVENIFTKVGVSNKIELINKLDCTPVSQ